MRIGKVTKFRRYREARDVAAELRQVDIKGWEFREVPDVRYDLWEIEIYDENQKFVANWQELTGEENVS